jgi:hypothetical protein
MHPLASLEIYSRICSAAFVSHSKNLPTLRRVGEHILQDFYFLRMGSDSEPKKLLAHPQDKNLGEEGVSNR